MPGWSRVRRRESPWADARVKDENHLRDVLVRLDAVQGRALRGSQRDLDTILRDTGFPRPGTLAEQQQMFALLGEVTRTVEEFGDGAFAPDLDARVAATAGRRAPERGLVALRRRERRRLRKDAGAASRSGLRKAPLHAALVAARQQRDRWLQLSAGRGGPHQVTGLTDSLQRFEEIRNSLAAVAACISVSDLEEQPTRAVDARIEALHADRGTFLQILAIQTRTPSIWSGSGSGLCWTISPAGKHGPEARRR